MNTHLTTVLSLEGMTCGSCLRRVRTILMAQPGVRGAEVRMREQEATVVHDAPLDLEPLFQQLAEHGYAARLAAPPPTTPTSPMRRAH